MEKTFAMLKPDAVRRGLIGKVIQRIESEGIKILAMNMTQLTVVQAKELYAVHKKSKHFESLVEFTASGPVVLMLLEGEDVISHWRKLLGATDSNKAVPGTIRGDFGSKEVIRENIAHGSDSRKSAEKEIEFYYYCGAVNLWSTLST